MAITMTISTKVKPCWLRNNGFGFLAGITITSCTKVLQQHEGIAPRKRPNNNLYSGMSKINANSLPATGQRLPLAKPLREVTQFVLGMTHTYTDFNSSAPEHRPTRPAEFCQPVIDRSCQQVTRPVAKQRQTNKYMQISILFEELQVFSCSTVVKG
jgi:hypothetical protein